MWTVGNQKEIQGWEMIGRVARVEVVGIHLKERTTDGNDNDNNNDDNDTDTYTNSRSTYTDTDTTNGGANDYYRITRAVICPCHQRYNPRWLPPEVDSKGGHCLVLLLLLLLALFV